MNSPTTSESSPELLIQRTFEAPRELVFRMWTEPKHLERWCCPTGFSIPFSEGDIREGGRFRTCMRSPQGEEHWLTGTYKEIKQPERIVFTHAWQDPQGNAQHETLVTVELEDDGGKTRLTLHQAFFQSAASRDGHSNGWQETLDSLER